MDETTRVVEGEAGRFARRLPLRTDVDRDDFAQVGLLAVWIHERDHGRPPPGLARRIASRAMSRLYYETAKRRATEEAAVVEMALRGPASQADADARIDVRDALSTLPDHVAEAVRRRIMDGESVAETAAALGRRRSSLVNYLRAGLDGLAVTLGDYGLVAARVGGPPAKPRAAGRKLPNDRRSILARRFAAADELMKLRERADR